MKMDEKLIYYPMYKNLSDIVLNQAAEYYIYLVTNQDDYWWDWYKQLDVILECRSFARSIGRFEFSFMVWL